MANNTKTRNRLVYMKGHRPSDSGETAWLGMANPPWGSNPRIASDGETVWQGNLTDEDMQFIRENSSPQRCITRSDKCWKKYIEQKEKDNMKKVNKYRIEKGVTIPRPRNSELVEAVEAMGVGESFEFEADKRQQCYVASKYREYEVTIRKVDEENCRVWRTG